MPPTTWFRSLRALVGRPTNGPIAPVVRPRRPAVRPWAEALEDRTVLSAPVPDGAEFRVNTTAAGIQNTTILPVNYNPLVTTNAVASDAAGNAAVVWSGNGPGDADGVFVQRYDAAGAAVGPETLVNTTTAGSQTNPVVARAASAGSYVAAWNTSGGSVRAQAFAADGSRVGGEILVAAGTSSTTHFVDSVATDASGNFVVLYRRDSSRGGQPVGWYAQRYNAAGQAQGRPIKVVEPGLINGQAGVAMADNGNFVVVWDDGGIYAQRYNSAGRTVGSRIHVNPDPSPALVQWQSNVAMDPAGNFLVTWVLRYQAPTPNEHRAQLFNADGTRRGTAFTLRSDSPEQPTAIAMEADGDFILAWHDDGVFAQRFDASGAAKEPAFQVNTTTAVDELYPSVAGSRSGDRFLVVWNNATVQPNPPSTDILIDCDVFAQRYTVPPSLLSAARPGSFAASPLEDGVAAEDASLGRPSPPTPAPAAPADDVFASWGEFDEWLTLARKRQGRRN